MEYDCDEFEFEGTQIICLVVASGAFEYAINGMR